MLRDARKKGANPGLPPLSRERSRLLDRLPGVNAWTMVAIGRLALAIFALAAIYADPTQPARDSELAYRILIFFVAYSAMLALIPAASVTETATYIVHAVDIGIFSVLVHLTEGPTSPLFPLFTFTLLSATIRWNWRGVVVTVAASIAIFAVLTLSSGAALADLNYVIMRSAHLIVAGMLFAYFGMIMELRRLRIEETAAWPASRPAEGGRVAFEPALQQAALVMRSRRVIAVWEDETRPMLGLAEWDGATTRLDQMPGALPDRPARQAAILSGAEDLRQSGLPDWIKDTCRLRTAIVAATHASGLKGWLIFADYRQPAEDLLPLARIVAARVAAEIVSQAQRARTAEAVALQERARLASEIHDDLLQGLAAVSIWLKSLDVRRGSRTEKQLEEIGTTLGDMQGRLRKLVTSMRQDQPSENFRVVDELTDLTDALEIQWRATIDLSVTPRHLSVPPQTGRSLSGLLIEAIANSVRHGRADQISVAVSSRTDGSIQLQINDNGCGLPAPEGDFDHDTVFREALGSASLRSRVQALGWQLAMKNQRSGLEIAVEVPPL